MFDAVGKERFKDAEIIVARMNKRHGHAPYVKQFNGECGAPGEFIHLTPSYVKTGVKSRFRAAGKTLLHQWGHFRWGLQDEHPKSTERLRSRFYFSTQTNRYEAVRCSLSSQGSIVQPLGNGSYRVCETNEGLPDHENCQFVPGFRVENPAKASVMDGRGTDEMDTFCEDSDDPFHAHNSEAPSKMNIICDGRSAWEVMKLHEDFERDEVNSARELSREDLIPEFKILQKDKQVCRVSLVVDRSGSMSGSLMEDLKRGLKKFVSYTISVGTEIGISSFSSDASIDCGMRQVDRQSDRDDFIGYCLNQYASGGTGIGDGILSGLGNLGDRTKGARIVVLTDGAQNSGKGPTHPFVLDQLDRAGVFVDVICFTKNADPAMLSLAERYGGSFYFDSDKSYSNSLNEAFLKGPCGGEEEEKDEEEVALLSAAGQISSPAEPVAGHFFVDEGLGEKTRILVDYAVPTSGAGSDAAGVSVNVCSPTGIVYTEDSPEYQVHTSFKSLTITIDKTEPGKWKYQIESRVGNVAQDYSINVISSVSSEEEEEEEEDEDPHVNKKVPIKLNSRLKNFRETFPSPMTVFVEALRGKDSVLNLNVTAFVDRPKSTELFLLPLLDDGFGADREKEDGIYSAFFSDYTAVGRYSFR